jgi:replicative DNA helicase
MATIDEILEHHNNSKVAGYYGIPFLDDFLGGIMPEDLIIISAETGAGKSQIAYDVAFRNAKDKKVLLMALEADTYEPQLRRYYSILANLYFNDKSDYKKKQDFSYRNFFLKKLDVSKYESHAKEIFASQPQPLIIQRENKFDAADIRKAIIDNIDGLGLVVLDHIDYIDLDLDQPENMQISEIMKTLREINMSFRIPVLAVSHLRKGNRKTLIPTIDDLMGSSNKAKQAKTVITLAKDKNADYTPGKYPTYISIQKSRMGSPGNIVALQTFNAELNGYESEYALFQYSSYNDSVEQLPEHLIPSWCRNKPPF